ncbi:hypothetical protein F4778DRAFT_743863 [Xylariomycetidae sp. FL2044]|nr:hypothetical protein F4778DRAFT_743863 [Xylariomycetidae sp. FL2044]
MPSKRAPKIIKRAPLKPREDKYPVRAADHLYARVIQDEDEYQASLSENAKQTNRHILKEIQASEAAAKRFSESTSNNSAKHKNYLHPGAALEQSSSPGKRHRASTEDDTSDDEPVFLYSSPVKKPRRASPPQAVVQPRIARSSRSTRPAPSAPPARAVKQPARKVQSRRQRRNITDEPFFVDEEPEDGEDGAAEEEEEIRPRTNLSTHEASESMSEDFAKLKMMMRDTRYLHLFQR